MAAKSMTSDVRKSTTPKTSGCARIASGAISRCVRAVRLLEGTSTLEPLRFQEGD